MSTDVCDNPTDPQTISLCSCREGVENAKRNTDLSTEAANAVHDWETNFKSKFAPDWEAKRDQIKNSTPWSMPGWNADSYAWFNKGSTGNTESSFGQQNFPSDSTSSPKIRGNAWTDKSAYVCQQDFEDRERAGSGGSACHYYYPKFCPSDTSCKKKDSGIRDTDITWTNTTVYDSEKRGNCDGLGDDTSALITCELSDSEINKRLNEWIDTYEIISDNSQYSCKIVYPQTPEDYMEHCSKRLQLIPPVPYPDTVMNCCTNYLNISGNTNPSVEDIHQDCSATITQQLQENSSPDSQVDQTQVSNTSTASPPSSSSSSDDNNAMIASGVVALILCLCCCLGLILVFFLSKKKV